MLSLLDPEGSRRRESELSGRCRESGNSIAVTHHGRTSGCFCAAALLETVSENSVVVLEGNQQCAPRYGIVALRIRAFEDSRHRLAEIPGRQQAKCGVSTAGGVQTLCRHDCDNVSRGIRRCERAVDEFAGVLRRSG